MLRLHRLVSLGKGFAPSSRLSPHKVQSTRLLQNYNSCLSTQALHLSSIKPAVAETKDGASWKEFREGAEVEGFVVQQVNEVADFQLTTVRLLHPATGAQYLHAHRDDGNNAFSVNFRTTPTDSTGLPHILEHTTLCGSQRYPCRDPFFKMLNRSMATFMNAMTGPDYTMYPFSTQNIRDYENLMSVYLDAVFRPKLEELDFRQEGWRLEHEVTADPTSPIIFKGVVFNEMKGVFAENQALFGQQLLNSILPGHTYGHVSGGDPLAIPSLTYDDLKAFHRHYYSPANARFYSYGNFPLSQHLKYVNANYLSAAKVSPDSGKKTAVPSELRWTSSRRQHIACRPDPMSADQLKQSSLAVGYLCSDINDIEETFVLQVLAELLVKGPNSAFYKSLVEPNIGAGFSPVTGYDAQTRDTIFSVGLQGLNAADFDRVVDIVDSTIDDVVSNGFAAEHIEGVLHEIELNMKHQTTDFGLGLLFGITPLWNHDGDLIRSLQIGRLVSTLRGNIAHNPRYLQDKVARHFKNNPHRLVLSMSPDEHYEAKQVNAEKEILFTKLAQLTDDDKVRVYEQGLKLLGSQQNTEDTSSLPTLKISDLKKELDRTVTKEVQFASVPIQVCSQPTNGITYFRSVVNTSNMSEELKLLLPLFTQVAAKMGTKNYDYRQFDQLVRLKTGGLGISSHIGEDVSDMRSYEEGLMFHSYCLDKNVSSMHDIWTELFRNIALADIARFSTLVRVIAGDLVNGVASAGHHYAMSAAAAQVSAVARRKERASGLSHIATMRRVARSEDLSAALQQMQEISQLVLSKSHMRCAVNLSPDNESSILSDLESFVKNLPGKSDESIIISRDADIPPSKSIHHILPIPVNFTAKSISTIPYTHAHFAPLRILSRLITSKYLHLNVREKGGAYGSGASLSTAGILNFYSFRDPNSTATLDIFDGSKDWVSLDKFTDEDIDEAKLGVFQNVDAPVPPGSKGVLKFLYGMTDELRQNHRVALMNVKRQDIHEVAEEYLESRKCGRALIGPENAALLTRESENWEAVVQE